MSTGGNPTPSFYVSQSIISEDRTESGKNEADGSTSSKHRMLARQVRMDRPDARTAFHLELCKHNSFGARTLRRSPFKCCSHDERRKTNRRTD